ncbi:S1 family peptidase [Actinomycetospora termitidis]|uniref:S1 family peptidase n=1 Tax=Actinomycetospora termitidis TaxID=3053470 RepID=A0ABT7MGI7_9PSEU|nr:S1 family peptidase [Actinomycetospora sp. Odt1-22]MDL5158458.1 S1 family peptidase [Actinomycetospora sp. Odt1-22]
MPVRKPTRTASAAIALALVTLIATAVPALAAPAPPGPTPPPLPSGPGSTDRHTSVEPRAGQAAKQRMDARRGRVPANVTAWYVDPATNQTVVAVVGPATRAATDFAADENPSAVRVQPMSAPVKPLAAAPLVGGSAITTVTSSQTTGGTTTTSGLRCSDGWSVRRGTTTYLLTAGHCTQNSTTWSGANRQEIGRVVRTQWPSADYGLIQVTNTAAWRGSGQVQGGPTVTGATEAPVGTQVCRSGSTSGYRCGVVQAKNVTVNYGGGVVVQGLTQTSACAESGDSGGSFLAPGTKQAQGILSGGTGSCTSGGTSYFQPLRPILNQFGLTLVTGS